MKQNKDKQIRELKKKYDSLIGLTIGIGAALLVLLIIINIINPFDKIQDLEQELQSCQEKVPIWVLNYICDWEEQGQFINSTWTFDDYGVYEFAKEELIEQECEVISE